MKYVCDALGGKTWFRIETEAEAAVESEGMRHAVEKFFRKEQEKAIQTFQPARRISAASTKSCDMISPAKPPRPGRRARPQCCMNGATRMIALCPRYGDSASCQKWRPAVKIGP